MSSTVTPQPPGKSWLCRTGHGLTISKKRNAANTPRVIIQLWPDTSCPAPGRVTVLHNQITVHEKKQTGIAVISSSTTEPGSFWPSFFSAAPHNQTERPMPSIVPASKAQMFAVTKSSANHPIPKNDPKVPGAKGILPTPKP